MKHYLYSLFIVLAGIFFSLTITLGTHLTNDAIISLQIPENNSTILGIQKYNIPPVSKKIPIPNISAHSILVKDLSTDTILYEKDAHTPLPIASTTKIMTALVASEVFKPNSVLTVNESANIEGAKVGLFKNESLTFRSLLYGMLLSSGNDASYAIAENYPGGVLGFVSAMNKKVAKLELKNTHFDNPAGFDSPRHYSTAFDLAKITEEALKDTQLSRVFATKETKIVSVDKKYKHNLVNLNKLLSAVNGVLGVKTGTTPLAKENLITLVDRDKHQILTVILGSNDRFGESTKLIEWAYENFTWPEIGIVR